MNNRLTFFTFLAISALVCIVSFAVLGSFNMRIDGNVYLSQVEQFEAGTLVLEPYDVALRAFKPFVGVWGSFLVPLISPVQAIQLMNILFIFLLPFVAFMFLRELDFSTHTARWGSLWIVTGYPVLKYGLAISTDLGGWVFAFLSAALVLKGLREESTRTIVLASLVGFVGGTLKETGVLGLLFGGLAILFTYRVRPWMLTVKFLSALVFPALALELCLYAVLISQGFPSFFEWFGLNNDGYSYTILERIVRTLGVTLSTFNLLLVYAFVGIWALLRRRSGFSKHPYAYALALALSVSPVLLWPITISRILFIQTLFVVPVALLGAETLVRSLEHRSGGLFKSLVYVFPVVASVLLLLVAGNGSLFKILPLVGLGN